MRKAGFRNPHWRSSENGKKRLIKEEVDGDDIANIVAKWTGIPVNRLQEDESKKLIEYIYYSKWIYIY